MAFVAPASDRSRLCRRCLLAVCLGTLGPIAAAQQQEGQTTLPAVPQTIQTPPSSSSAPPPAAGISISLEEAIKRARVNEPTYAAAAAAASNARLDRSIARSALLPSVDYHNQYLYTQPVKCPLSNVTCAANAANNSSNASASNPAISSSAPRFIANNAVHEYVSQGQVNETIGVQQFNALSRATGSLAVATAELEVARRGLVATVANLFYSLATSQRRIAVAQRAVDEAASLTHLTQQREAEREVAHADVIKAQLEEQRRERELADAKLNAEKARLELGVLLFPDPRSPYSLALPTTPAALPSRADVEAALARRNPELQSALATTRLANIDVAIARAAYLPNLALNYSYGIDASQFAVRAPDGSRNLGYSASVTLDIPVWDWFTTRDKIRQSEINRNTARTVLTNTQRKLLATLEENYAEAVAAHDQLDSLNQSVATATESLRLTRLSYSAGETPILSVVDAENSLTTAETALEDGVVRYQTALANLQLLTGML